MMGPSGGSGNDPATLALSLIALAQDVSGFEKRVRQLTELKAAAEQARDEANASEQAADAHRKDAEASLAVASDKMQAAKRFQETADDKLIEAVVKQDAADQAASNLARERVAFEQERDASHKVLTDRETAVVRGEADLAAREQNVADWDKKVKTALAKMREVNAQIAG